MQKLKYISIWITFLIFLACHYSNDKSGLVEDNSSGLKIEDAVVTLPFDTNIVYKRLKTTVEPNEIEKIKQMSSLTEADISSWLLPLTNMKGEQVKLVSFQGQTEKAYLIIIANIFGFNDFEDEQYFDMEQYFISISKKDGKLIDGMKVQGYKSGDSLGDSILVEEGLILNVRTSSNFFDRSIVVNDKILLLNPPTSHDEKDVREKIVIRKIVIRENGRLIRE